jgi:hypothetical protein
MTITKAAHTAGPAKAQLAQEAAIKAVLAAGFVADGETRSETVRMPTMDCPVSNRGKSGGELTTFGGRQRFAIPETTHRVTVGPRTTNFYEFEKGKEIWGFRPFETFELDAIRAAAEARANG